MGLPHSAHAAVVLFMTLTGFILSILIVFSGPFVPGIWFVRTESAGQFTTFGVYGTCNETACTRRRGGYEVSGEAVANRAMTGPMVMPGLHSRATLHTAGIGERRAGSASGREPSYSPRRDVVLIGFTTWIISVVGWSIVLRASHIEGGSGKLGPAIWMGLASVLASLIAMVLGVPTDAGPGTVDMNPPSMLQPEAGRTAGAALAPRDGYWHYKHTTRIVEE
ncbi:hypothetical protein A1Q2_03219 [Trichosporon asahii var. asahii CBS 8904]|uniref:Uncharacterized protein n=1 Tax=Trichosporon asahii var. asahii (strain CBS 8904) TaxID=1220162 RepID=K1WMV2_TRIAC|nr:hypothetical protein A1Q2_03219 [Trichosporon asahii var. asahii CBS 8904]